MRRTRFPAKMTLIAKPYYPTNTWQRYNIEFRKITGPAIYFLMKDTEIVYIGQTMDMSKRVYRFYHEHGSERFNMVVIYRPDFQDIRRVPWWNKADKDKWQENFKAFLLDLESYFIQVYKPKFNQRSRSYVGQRKLVNPEDTSLTQQLNWLNEQVTDWILNHPI